MMLSTNNVSDIDNQIGNHETPLPREICIFLAISLIIAMIIGTVGNLAVLGLFLRYKSLRTASNLFVVNLTIADLLMCIACFPMLINYYIQGQTDNEIEKVFCVINMFLGAFIGFLSIWSLVCLAFDRCIVMSRPVPVRYPSDKTKASYIIIAIWIFCFVAAFFPLTGIVSYVLEGRSISCGNKDGFTTSASNILFNVFLQVLFFAIPIICIISCYFNIFMKVRNHEKIFLSLQKCGKYDDVLFRRIRKNKNLEQMEMKTARAGIILISIFCVSWAPFSIVSWIGLFGNRDLLTPVAIALPAIFAKIFTIVNPLLYALLLPSFKSKLVICCKKYFLPKSSPYGSVQTNNPRTECPDTNINESNPTEGPTCESNAFSSF